ncbi:putative IQ and AAA domain-containing protein 1 [Apostichopus japonicus]|uniref:Putative IQ and AAA domain-containing protein 1 n=1 Tax=Stichopus japonicus TaxID=307972 RepID=A0A2G8JV49_STIJA|nr:putative IQ and AAA domain-containing protein 1 [Apostichopus japonicus]
MGDCEKTWMKKVPKTDKSDPKRLKKDLPKVLKLFKPEDRILLVGTSRCPFESEIRVWLVLPEDDPDTQTRLCLTTKVTDGYTQKHIVTACQQVLTDRRVTQLAKRPLVASEFIPPLARIDPIYKEEEEAFKTWYAKTPLGKKEAKAAEGVTKMTARGRKERKEARKAKRERRRSRLLLEK